MKHHPNHHISDSLSCGHSEPLHLSSNDPQARKQNQHLIKSVGGDKEKALAEARKLQEELLQKLQKLKGGPSVPTTKADEKTTFPTAPPKIRDTAPTSPPKAFRGLEEPFEEQETGSDLIAQTIKASVDLTKPPLRAPPPPLPAITSYPPKEEPMKKTDERPLQFTKSGRAFRPLRKQDMVVVNGLLIVPDHDEEIVPDEGYYPAHDVLPVPLFTKNPVQKNPRNDVLPPRGDGDEDYDNY